MISNIWALIKAVPMLKGMFDKLVDLHIEEKINQIVEERIGIDDQINSVYRSIEKAESNQERAALSIVLHKLNNGSLSEQPKSS